MACRTDQNVADKQSRGNEAQAQPCFAGHFLLDLLEHGHNDELQKETRNSEEQYRACADIAADVAPVEDLGVVVPESDVEELKEEVARRKFQYACSDAGEQEYEERVLFELVSKAEHEDSAEAVDGDPGAEGRAAFYPFTQVKAVEDLFINEAEDSAKSEHEHKHRDSGFGRQFAHKRAPLSRCIEREAQDYIQHERSE